jgi:nicotinate-nucleotide adenylyltransferase
MRIALFGGSFDPPHCGHIGIAQAAADRLALDRVLMAPVGRQPLKRHQAQSSYKHRLAMVQLACQGHPRLQPSEIDAPADGNRLNYTYDALQRLRQQLTAGDALFCLIGADSLTTLQRWHRAAEAMLLAEWVVAARPGFALETLSRLLPHGVSAGNPVVSGETTRVPLLSHAASPEAHGVLWLLPDLHYEVSATQLRKALADHSAGIPQRVLDPRVADYARSHRLYDGEALAPAEP